MTDAEIQAAAERYMKKFSPHSEYAAFCSGMREGLKLAAEKREVCISDLVNSFLSWPLPQSVCSDLCVTNNKYPHLRSGTSLLTADEARQMFEHVLKLAQPDKRNDLQVALDSARKQIEYQSFDRRNIINENEKRIAELEQELKLAAENRGPWDGMHNELLK